MKWISAVSPNPATEAAVDAVSRQIRLGLAGERADLLLVFATGHHRPHASLVASELEQAFPDAALIGAVSAGVVGGGQEFERAPSLSVLAARLPNVGCRAFHLGPRDLGPAGSEVERWRAKLGIGPEHQPCFVLLADPITTNTDALLRSLDVAYPSAAKVGGLTAGVQPPEQSALLFGGRALHAGVVGVALYGDIVLDALVAQGARPVGERMLVTAAQRNLIEELDGEPAMRVLERELSRLSELDRALLRRSPLLGVAQDRGREEQRAGDFLVRDVVGVDQRRGAVALGAAVRPGAVIQLHIRDPKSAAEELHDLLARYRRGHDDPAAALMFSCVGRGAGFFGHGNHDSRILAQHLGRIPTGGLFCGGEIGPVHSRTWLHAYTTSFGLLRAPSWN